MKETVLETASLHWRNANTPVSDQYGDVYFSADDGYAESEYVYLQNNFLASRFQQLTSNQFTIAETGFGTGLNFLLAWNLWQRHYQTGKKLYYISTEKFPLHHADLQQSLACWPALAELAKELCASYPPPLTGLHCIELSFGVTLILLLGDATNSFNLLLENNHPDFSFPSDRAVDAWFLDGFAPAKNPDMWSEALFAVVGKLSKRSTTFASFTAAGVVRRGLQGVGFSVEKVTGFGKKREMIRGEFIGLPTLAMDITASVRARPYQAFWPIHHNYRSASSVLVIGAGIAGCTTAKALADAGLTVTLVDSHALPLQGASGNPQAVLFPKLSYETGSLAEFNLFSWLYALRFYRNQHFQAAFEQCGMLQMLVGDEFASAEKVLQRFHGLNDYVSRKTATESSQLANTRIDTDCLWYPQTGWLQPSVLRDIFMHDKRIQFSGNTTITRLYKQGDQWKASSDKETFTTDAVVICNAWQANALLQSMDFQLPVKSIRGQITQFPAQDFTTLNTVICHEGYICPTNQDRPNEFTCGSSYDLKNNAWNLDADSQAYNIRTLKAYLPDFSALDITATPLQGRVEFRCTTPDYLPVIGPIPDTKAFLSDYALYAKNTKAHIPVTGTYQNGLFVNIAHGSRGFCSAPLSAAMIRSYILGQPFPLPFSLATSLNPARFLIRDIGRRVYD